MYIIRATIPNQETQYQVADRIAAITLDRPDKLNAWTAVMEHEVHAAIAAAENDGNVRVIVLTGAGRGFCAGADMSLLSAVGKRNRRGATGTGGAAYRRDRRGHPSGFSKEVFVFPGHHQALIAAVNGPAVSLGLVIALYCDLRVASDASPLWH